MLKSLKDRFRSKLSAPNATLSVCGRGRKAHCAVVKKIPVEMRRMQHRGAGLRSQKNFIGCLRDVRFNDEDLLDALNFTVDDNEQVKYHGDGPPMLGCHDLTVSCIQFTHDAAFARIEHPPADSFDLQLTLRTLKSDCVLTYTETSAATQRGFVQVSCLPQSCASTFSFP